METETKERKSAFDNPFFRTKITSGDAKLWPEGLLGYLVGPTLALIANSILANYFNSYMSDVMGITEWASWFFNWLPVISVVFVVLGNVIVGRLMDSCRTAMGKARPLILISVPVSLIALLVLLVVCPLATGDSSAGTQASALVCIAIGYILWFAIAYPLYFTPHSSLVNLSTRNSSSRSLMATLSNATALAAMGIGGMIFPYFLWFFFEENEDGTINAEASYNHWKILVIVLIVITLIGALIEFWFTRERITEESLGDKLAIPKRAEPMGKQARVCLHDKLWWIMIIFFFLYQFGGMIKNVSIKYFCSTWYPETLADGTLSYSVGWGGTMAGTLSIIAAIPTAIGMFICWPISNVIGKGKAIVCGAAVAVIGGIIAYFGASNFYVTCVGVAIKALGSTPAMYLGLALFADVLDHQEAKHGFRTDGFSMTVYGAIMAGMTGLATGVLNIVLSGVGYSASDLNNATLQTAMTWVYIGGETICYLLILIIILFMTVEKFSKRDHDNIAKHQKAAAEAAGEEWIPAEEKLRREEEESKAMTEAGRVEELKKTCEKKGLSFEEEEAKYQADKAEKDRVAAEKKKASDEVKAAKAEQKRQVAEAKRQADIEKISQSKGISIEDAEKEYQKQLDDKAAKKAEKERIFFEKEDADDIRVYEADVLAEAQRTGKQYLKDQKKADEAAAKLAAAQEAADAAAKAAENGDASAVKAADKAAYAVEKAAWKAKVAAHYASESKKDEIASTAEAADILEARAAKSGDPQDKAAAEAARKRADEAAASVSEVA